MVKDNHLMTDGDTGHLQACIDKLKSERPGVEVQLEADNLQQVEAFLKLNGVDYILLDNMSDEMMAEAVKLVHGRSKLEASGGITLTRLPAIGRIGVDFVSSGALTHSVKAADISLDIVVEEAR
jgi:nicotinate-nucleotide pyrophosphorylase (carboxylating)